MKTAAPRQFSPERLAAINRKPSVSKDQYRQAIETLLPLARGDTGGSAPAAMVLLSAYDGYHWTVSIPDFCYFDWKHYDAAMTVIAGRVELSIEPHNLIENGSEIFKALARDYACMSAETGEDAA